MKSDLSDLNSYRVKCLKCHRPQTSCMCSFMKPFHTEHMFVFLMHPMEFKKEKNGTGRLAHLQLTNSKIIIGIDYTKDKEVNKLIDQYDTAFILYPGDDAINISSGEGSYAFKSQTQSKPSLFFIIDGTWPCAKKMLKLSKNLQSLQKISFDTNIKSDFIIKQQPNKLCLSTIESLNVFLSELKKFDNINIEQSKLDTFLDPFKAMIDYQVKCINDPSKNKYRSDRNSKVKEKVFYKKKTQRNIFYKE